MEKILIVDDIGSNRRVLQQMLRVKGYEVIEAVNGKQAVDLSKVEKPDLILMDISMPEMDGHQAASQIKESSGDNYIPIIFVTAMSEDTALTKALASGGDDFLSKPVSIDILDSKVKAHLRIRKLNRQLQAKNQELESFAHTVSHDLRSPLRSIVGYSSMLKEDYLPKLDATAEGYIDRIVRTANRMAQIIDDLLLLAQSSQQAVKLEEIDLSEIASVVVNRLRDQQPNRLVEVSIMPGIVAHGDKRLLQIIFENLFGNAWKYTTERESAIIEFGVQQQSKQVVYYVHDNGVGFDMASAENLFEAFKRLHKFDDFEGTGIGLATVARLIHRHGGKVWAEAEVDKGATFYFTLSA